MRAIILAGGYATRLGPLTSSWPKALLPVAGRALLDHILDRLEGQRLITGVLVLTNRRFERQFRIWLSARRYPALRLLVENSERQEEKLGALGALTTLPPESSDDYLVIAGDNLFTGALDGLIRQFERRRATILGVYEARNRELVSQFSCVTLADDGQVVGFVEKPRQPTTNLVGTGIYAFPSAIFGKIREFIRLDGGQDEPGRFIQWLYPRAPVYGHVLEGGWWDIGTPDQYRAAQTAFGLVLADLS